MRRAGPLKIQHSSAPVSSCRRAPADAGCRINAASLGFFYVSRRTYTHLLQYRTKVHVADDNLNHWIQAHDSEGECNRVQEK